MTTASSVSGRLAMRYASPLRYPGGKAKVLNFIKLVLIENELFDVEYVEPFAGGASVALGLLFEDFASHVHINDINAGVHAFWQAVVDDTDALCQRIRDTKPNLTTWRRQKEVQQSSGPDPLDLAFSTFFLSRTNRSGIIRGGVIGGFAQDSKWNIDARYNTPDLIRRIEKVARFKSRITVSRIDAATLLQQLGKADHGHAWFWYLDPPYYHKAERLYDNFYTHEDHVNVSRLIRAMRMPWLVSYDSAEEITAIYKGVPSITYALRHSAASSRTGREVMFHSSDLLMPRRVPVGVSSRDVDLARQLTLS